MTPQSNENQSFYTLLRIFDNCQASIVPNVQDYNFKQLARRNVLVKAENKLRSLKSLFRILPNIYDGFFFPKQLMDFSPSLFWQKSFTIDAGQGSKYAQSTEKRPINTLPTRFG